MVITSSHQWVERRLLLTSVFWCVRVVHGDDEVIHVLQGCRLSGSWIFNHSTHSTGSSSSILWALFLVIVSLCAIFNTEVGVSVVVLPSWTSISSKTGRSIIVVVLRIDSHWVDLQSEVFFKMSRAQNLKLEDWSVSLFHKFSQHCLSALNGRSEVVWDFLIVENIKSFVLHYFRLVVCCFYLHLIWMLVLVVLVVIIGILVIILFLLNLMVHAPLISFLISDHVLHVFAHWLR